MIETAVVASLSRDVARLGRNSRMKPTANVKKIGYSRIPSNSAVLQLHVRGPDFLFDAGRLLATQPQQLVIVVDHGTVSVHHGDALRATIAGIHGSQRYRDVGYVCT